MHRHTYTVLDGEYEPTSRPQPLNEHHTSDRFGSKKNFAMSPREIGTIDAVILPCQDVMILYEESMGAGIKWGRVRPGRCSAVIFD